LKLQQQAFYNLGNVQFQKAKNSRDKDLDAMQDGLEARKDTRARSAEHERRGRGLQSGFHKECS
jgi:hypothetical protein